MKSALLVVVLIVCL